MDFASVGPFDSLSMSSDSLLSDSDKKMSTFFCLKASIFPPHALINNNLEYQDNWNAGISSGFIY